MLLKTRQCFYSIGIVCALCLLAPVFSFASTTDGTIQAPDQYAWGENVGWINFAPTGGDVHITNSDLTGYFWDSVHGWTNLNPTGSGVLNDGNGNLSGYAWNTGAGFINFSGVRIDSSGVFHGQAQGSAYGRINFDCSTCHLVTDWRASITPISSGGGIVVGTSSLIVYVPIPGFSTTSTNEVPPIVVVSHQKITFTPIPGTAETTSQGLTVNTSGIGSTTNEQGNPVTTVVGKNFVSIPSQNSSVSNMVASYIISMTKKMYEGFIFVMKKLITSGLFFPFLLLLLVLLFAVFYRKKQD